VASGAGLMGWRAEFKTELPHLAKGVVVDKTELRVKGNSTATW
jgi:hypothetical protein